MSSPAAARIRPATVADLALLPAIERSAAVLFAGTHMAWALGLPFAGVDAYRVSLDEQLLWVAARDSVVGFIAGSLASDCVFVEELSVAHPHQRSGIGRALLERLVREAELRGKRAVGLTTDRHLPWNRPFYLTAGFVDLAPETDETWLVERLRREADHGHDSTRRCAMIWRL
jgi:GNAT superfamily N-acetyltransferase